MPVTRFAMPLAAKLVPVMAFAILQSLCLRVPVGGWVHCFANNKATWRDKMKKLNELVKEYVDLCDLTMSYAEIIGRRLIEWCKPVIDDLCFSVEGIDVIAFYSKKDTLETLLSAFYADKAESYKLVYFVDIVEEIIPLLEGHIKTPYGIYLTPEEAERLRQLLEEIKKEVM